MKISIVIFIIISLLNIIKLLKMKANTSNQTKTKTSIFESLKKFSNKSYSHHITNIINDNDNSSTILDEKSDFQCSVKFFKYNNSKSSVPRAFFINPQFINEYKKNNQYHHDNDDFFVRLDDKEITFYTTQENIIQSSFDVLSYDNISTRKIGDFGNYSEGYCIKANTKDQYLWIICTKTIESKNSLINYINKAINKCLYNLSQIDVGKKERESVVHYTKNNSTDVNDDQVNGGYWKVISDYSSCSKACGGGTQTLQRICVGGKQCIGSNILTKPCNVKSCPFDQDAIKLDYTSNNKQIKLDTPVVKVLPFSNRPQRYEKCIIKESDLLLTQENTISKVDVNQVPIRLIMNVHTISIFTGFTDKDKLLTYTISKTLLENSSRDKNCFKFKEQNKEKTQEFEVCPFGVSSDANMTIKQEWERDFSLFKNQCHKERKVKYLGEIEVELKHERERLIEEIKLKRKEKVKIQQLINPTVNRNLEVIDKIKENAIKEIEKENKLEKLLQMEVLEEQKEKLNIKKEQLKKSECIENALNEAIKQKEIENQTKISNIINEKHIIEVKNRVENEIKQKRERFREKLKELKEKANLKINTLDNQIETVRLKILKNERLKNLDVTKCNISKFINFDEEKRKYCALRFDNIESTEQIKFCFESTKDSFIELCCKNEADLLNNPEEYVNCINEFKLVKVNNINVVNLEEDESRRLFWDSKFIHSSQNNISNIMDASRIINSVNNISFSPNSQNSSSNLIGLSTGSQYSGLASQYSGSSGSSGMISSGSASSGLASQYSGSSGSSNISGSGSSGMISSAGSSSISGSGSSGIISSGSASSGSSSQYSGSSGMISSGSASSGSSSHNSGSSGLSSISGSGSSGMISSGSASSGSANHNSGLSSISGSGSSGMISSGSASSGLANQYSGSSKISGSGSSSISGSGSSGMISSGSDSSGSSSHNSGSSSISGSGSSGLSSISGKTGFDIGSSSSNITASNTNNNNGQSTNSSNTNKITSVKEIIQFTIK